MIIVDDRLASAVVAGYRKVVLSRGPVATTWGFHYRLVRALTDRRVSGRLSRGQPDDALRSVIDPTAHGLQIIDPRELTTRAAEASIRYRLNLLAAELVAAAQVHEAGVVLSEGNVGRRWPDLFSSLGIPLIIV